MEPFTTQYCTTHSTVVASPKIQCFRRFSEFHVLNRGGQGNGNKPHGGLVVFKGIGMEG